MRKLLRVRSLGLLLTILITLTLAPGALAVDKVGTTSMQLLKIPVDLRGIGMGNAAVAVVHDAEAVWSNPGALTEFKGKQFIATQINLPSDINLNSFVFATQLDDYSAASVHVMNLYMQPIKERTYYQPLGTGREFDAWDLVAGVGYTRKLLDRFSLGGNLRYLHSRLDMQSYDGASFDLGTIYTTNLRTLRLGMSIQNLGPNVKYSGQFDDYRNATQNGGQVVKQNFQSSPLPTMFRLGIGFDPFVMFGIQKSADYSSAVSVEMNHPNDMRERLNLGGEVGYRNMFYLRLGGKIQYDQQDVAFGFGVKVPVFDGYKVRADVAYSHNGILETATDGFMDKPYRLAVGFEW
jgi:long-subunit fatty acid transport protein